MPDQRKKFIYLKITDDGLFYNDRHYFKWTQTNFPNKNDFAWQEHVTIFWKVELVNFDKLNKILDVRVDDYNETNLEFFKIQKPKDVVREIHFHDLNWALLQGQLRSYVYSSFMHLAEEPTVKDVNNFEEAEHSNLVSILDAEEQNTREISFSFKADVSDLTVKNGYAQCLHYVDEIAESLEIRLYNDALLAQFDHIKPYFKKYFKKKRVQIQGTATKLGDGVWTTKCRCDQIMQIDEKAITSIRRLVLKDRLSKPQVISIDKSLFTSEDIFLDENKIDIGKALRVDERDLMKEIMDLKDIRNRKQLIYLSGKIQDPHTAIRFTLAPHLGFLFYTSGKEMCHFIWELIDTHATYIWSATLDPKLLDQQFEAIERTVNIIRANGRRAYLTDPNQQDFLFQRIAHKQANSRIMDAFPLWKARLDERLV